MNYKVLNACLQRIYRYTPVAVSKLVVAAMLLLPSVSQAEINGICCGKWIVLSETGAGFARNWECEKGMKKGTPQLRTKICQQLMAQGNLCPEIAPFCGREGPPPPETGGPSKKEPCGDWAGPRAQLDLALDQQKVLMDQLAQRYDRYRAILDQAQGYQGDFELVSRNCDLWEAARTLMSVLISNFAPRIPGRLPGHPTMEPGKQVVDFFNWVEKVLANDGSWILPNHEFKSWVSLEDAWDGYKNVYDAAQSSPDELLARLQQCTDPITHDIIYQDAVKYVRLLQEIEPLMEQVQRTLNDLRQKDLELLDKWTKAHQACLEYQECRGASANDCDQLQGGTEP